VYDKEDDDYEDETLANMRVCTEDSRGKARLVGKPAPPMLIISNDGKMEEDSDTSAS
jgi:hypothetical protein